jgi:hypothetical protein
VRKTGRTTEPNSGSHFVESAVALVNAALGVGAALTKTVAIATAGERPVPKPSEDAPPISVLVHYSLAIVTNVLKLVIVPVKESVGEADTVESPRARSSARPSVPPGATLRIPLSIENPTDSPMNGLSPLIRAVRRDGQDASADLPYSTLRFTPSMLDVAPKDFEKLTVEIAVPDKAPLGSYEFMLALGPEQPDIALVLDVIDDSVE